ncbi:peptide deformylase [Streptomyces massasporeus]|uniref:peptide deformylase n=1 Tax=Streptomyces massasporeus TaxID=67324 RepID=UPI0036BE421A
MEHHDTPGAVRPIVVLGDPVLHRPCEPVTSFDAELSQLIDDMFATMYAAKGVGLAANQIGVTRAVFVYDCPDAEGESRSGHVVNPVLRSFPAGAHPVSEGDEGCLSIPGTFAMLDRPEYAVVEGFDRHGAPRTIEATGWFARCLQHETDHLNGVLFTDRLPT